MQIIHILAHPSYDVSRSHTVRVGQAEQRSLEEIAAASSSDVHLVVVATSAVRDLLGGARNDVAQRGEPDRREVVTCAKAVMVRELHAWTRTTWQGAPRPMCPKAASVHKSLVPGALCAVRAARVPVAKTKVGGWVRDVDRTPEFAGHQSCGTCKDGRRMRQWRRAARQPCGTCKARHSGALCRLLCKRKSFHGPL